MKKVILWCGFVLWMEGVGGDYQPIVGFEDRARCMAALAIARSELGTESFLTCFPVEFDPRKIVPIADPQVIEDSIIEDRGTQPAAK